MDNVFLQYVFIFFVSMIPFLETFLTVPLAIIVFDFPPIAVVIVAIFGNAMSVLLFILFGTEINKLVSIIYYKLHKKDKKPIKMNARIKRTFDRFGATGVCFFSSILFSSQIGAFSMTTLGAKRSQIFVWTNLGVSALAVAMAILSVMAEGFVITLVNL
ncbi:small multi-drug export protein [Alkalihalobacillus sp. MEB130]|uniref:small multi-drug export protein n=1 Tax=Alkalihalobacillus sp. MEB130 TaxID=2976704 RepID=UPI0028DD52F9|nr:small multi-drug export protein [Alkalihalobacillus sp. MEB130]MDT8862114.1 small multi-drug export protein [Alkalihalobacillus sp. MEB130]